MTFRGNLLFLILTDQGQLEKISPCLEKELRAASVLLALAHCSAISTGWAFNSHSAQINNRFLDLKQEVPMISLIL